VDQSLILISGPNACCNVKATDTIGSIAAEHRVSGKSLLEVNPNSREPGGCSRGRPWSSQLNNSWL